MNNTLSTAKITANYNIELDSHTGNKHNQSHQEDTTSSHTGVVPQLQLVNNSHTGVASHREARKYTNSYSHQRGATISHTGVVPLPQSVNNSHTGVTSQIGVKSHGATISHTGVALQSRSENNSHTRINTYTSNTPTDQTPCTKTQDRPRRALFDK